MKFLLVALAVMVVLSFPNHTMAQTELNQTSSKNVDFSKVHPTVYLSFEKYGDYESPCGEDKIPGIWLRLTNNTKWAIFVEGTPVMTDSKNIVSFKLSDNTWVRGVKDRTEMKLRYDLESVSKTETKNQNGRYILFSPVDIEIPKQSKYCSQKWMGEDVGRIKGFWIASGASILFSLPKNFLTENLKVNAQYNYEWESEDGKVKDFEPHHLVYFYGSDLEYKK